MISLILLIFTTYYLKRKFGVSANFHPAFFIPFFTIIIIVVPIFFALLDPVVFIYNMGIEAIAFLMLIFQVGAIVVLNGTSLTYPQPSIKLSFTKLKKLQIIGIIFSLVGLYLTMKEIAQYGGIPLSFSHIPLLPNINSVARYSGTQVVTGIAFYLGIIDYSTLIIGGILLASKQNKFLSLLPVFIGLFKAYVVGARAGFLIAFIFFLSALIIYKAYLNRGYLTLFTFKMIRIGLISISLIFAFFLVVQMARGGVSDLNRIPQLLTHLNNWFFAYLPAFSVWLDSYSFDEFHFGAFTLAGIFDQLDIIQRDQGIYKQPVIIGLNIRTNVFTLYKGLILDFHILSIPIMFCLGLISSIAYHQFFKFGNWFYFFVLLVIYSFFLCQHAVSIFNYNTIIIGVFIGFLIIKFSSTKFVVNGDK
ncbi:MAG: O-antigen polymerase [Candidatus Cyclobacteriaceae bacterium M2_1C_046]